MDDISSFFYVASTWVIPGLLAITLHEAAHGYVANMFGDHTARDLGRVTINPLRHVHPMGTIVLPGILVLTSAPFLFGWAKPVPVNFGGLNHPKRDMIWVAAAGPAVNLLMALVAAVLFNFVVDLPADAQEWVADNLVHAIIINVGLAVFNLIPIPPLDGGRIAVGLLPLPLAIRYARIERFGMPLIIGLVLVLPWVAREMGFKLDILWWAIGPVVRGLTELFAHIAGAL